MIHCIFYIETQSNNKIALENAIKQTKQELEKIIKDVNISIEDIIEDDSGEFKTYSGVLEAEMKVDFRTYINLALRFAPSAIEIFEEDIVLSSSELLLIFGDVSTVVSNLCRKLGMSLKFQEGKKLQEEVGLDEDFIEETIDEGGILLRIVSEVEGKSIDKLEETMIKMINSMGGYVNKMKYQEVEGALDQIGIEVLFENVEDSFHSVARMVPVAVRIEEPEEIYISMREIQNIGMDLSNIISLLTTEAVVRKKP